jgi:DNA-binding NarL/FixJ family response regulator
VPAGRPIPRDVDAAERTEILSRYAEHVRRFEEVASHLHVVRDNPSAGVVPFQAPRRAPGREPTRRELDVLRLIAQGLTSRELAERLCLSEETVRTHVRHLLEALQVHSRAHAVAVGFRRGIID